MKKSKDIVRILNDATPREKALLICKGYYEGLQYDVPQQITEEEVNQIKGSVKAWQAANFNRWLKIYRTYTRLNPLLGEVYKEYQSQAERVLTALSIWDAYTEEENHLNTAYQELLSRVGDEAAGVFLETMRSQSLKYGEIKISETGYIKIDTTLIKNYLKNEIDVLKITYEAAKAMVIVTEAFIKKTRSKAFLPKITEGAISEIKEDYACRVAPIYSRKRLQEKIDKGLKVTAAEREKAIYPYYEEIEAPAKFLDMFSKSLKNTWENA